MHLVSIDRTAQTFNLPVASRSYRSGFSANYRALFPDNSRLYRVDVLETSLDQHSEIWVNGEKFELSPEAIGHADALQQAWSDLCALLERWQRGGGAEDPKPSRAELATALVSLDMAWAQFECRYITELIAIEERARQLVVIASELEAKLRTLQKQGSPDAKEAEVQLVKCIAHLNSIANFKCKGRDDLGYDILVSAVRVMQRCDDSLQAVGPNEAARRGAARALAADVIDAYQAMRVYLRQVGTCIERVDPHLCNNPGLVARLVDWETSWEVGARYVREAQLLDAVCDIVAEVKAAQDVVPALTEMCEDCDVELFLALPRIVLLLFTADPTKHRAGLLQSLLPHRFEGDNKKLHLELSELVKHFNEALDMLVKPHGSAASAMGPGQQKQQQQRSSPSSVAWQLLVKRAIAGDGEAADIYGSCSPAAQTAVEGLMREVEKWSLELQRHCPQDWNQCSAVLVQCLTGNRQKKTNVKFQV